MTEYLPEDERPHGGARVVVTFKWWERPRWLWREHARNRTRGYLAVMRARLNQTGPYAP